MNKWQDIKDTISKHTFEIKLGLINVTGYAHAAAFPLYFDQLISNNVYGKRIYNCNYYVIAAFLIIIFFSTCYTAKIKSSKLSPFIIIVLSPLLFYYFRVEPLNGHVLTWITTYSMTTFITSWIHYHSESFTYVDSDDIAEAAKIERIKESIAFWRTIVVALSGSFIIGVITCASAFWQNSKVISGVESDALLLAMSGSLQLTIYSICFVIGPIFEAYSRLQKTPDKLLGIRPANNSARSTCYDGK